VTGHTMSVTLHVEAVWLKPVCHEPDGAICRVECAEGCFSYTYPEHEHELTPREVCNAVEWMTAGECVVESYGGGSSREISLHDGMAINVRWNGEYYEWTKA
jgi:hypothetical protein